MPASSSPVPRRSKADRTFDLLRAQLNDGSLGQAGDRFKPVRALADEHDLSLATAQKVLAKLKGCGLLVGDATNVSVIGPGVGRKAAADVEAKSKAIGIIVTSLANPSIGVLAQELERAAEAMGYQSLLASSHYDFGREAALVERFKKMNVAGFVVVPGLDERASALYWALHRNKVPLVFVSRRLEDVAVDSATVNHMLGGQLVAEHFLKLGFKSAGYIGRRELLHSDPRLMGYRGALMKEGVIVTDDLIAPADGWQPEAGYRAMGRLLELPKPPRAVFGFTDLLAIGAVRCCRDRGLRIPQDIAIAGFDDGPEAWASNPSLTSVGYPFSSMADLALSSLRRVIESGRPATPMTACVEPHLVVRESTDASATVPQTRGMSASRFVPNAAGMTSGGEVASSMSLPHLSIEMGGLSALEF